MATDHSTRPLNHLALHDICSRAMHESFEALQALLHQEEIDDIGGFSAPYMTEMLARQALGSLREMMDHFGEVEDLLALGAQQRMRELADSSRNATIAEMVRWANEGDPDDMVGQSPTGAPSAD